MAIQFTCDDVSWSDYGMDKQYMVKNIPYQKRKLWFVSIVEIPILDSPRQRNVYMSYDVTNTEFVKPKIQLILFSGEDHSPRLFHQVQELKWLGNDVIPTDYGWYFDDGMYSYIVKCI